MRFVVRFIGDEWLRFFIWFFVSEMNNYIFIEDEWWSKFIEGEW
jgi:hypothetical protein